MITGCASVQLDALLEAGGDRELLMARLLMPPEEWELLRPTAWTPSDGVSLQRYRLTARLYEARVFPIDDLEAYRVLQLASRFGDETGPMLFVRPRPERLDERCGLTFSNGNWVEAVNVFENGEIERIAEGIRVAMNQALGDAYDEPGASEFTDVIARVLADATASRQENSSGVLPARVELATDGLEIRRSVH